MPLSFQSFLLQARSAGLNDRGVLVDAFLERQKARGFPIVDYTSVCFVYSGPVKNRIAVTGDHMHWSATGETMNTLEGTDFHYLGKRFESDARLDYKFIVDGEWILDPLNPRVSAGGFGLDSELRMPDYLPTTDIVPLDGGPCGSIQSLTVRSNVLHTSRELRIYLPAAYGESTKPFPAVFFNDGPEYLTLAMADHVLNNTIANKKVEPVIGIFIPPGIREQEFRLAKLDAYTKFIVQEALPAVRNRWNLTTSPEQCAMVGVSDGGHAALWMSFAHPEVFGMAGAQSATITDRLLALLESTACDGRKFSLDCGRYDLTGFSENFLHISRLLRSRGGDVAAREWNEGHSWGNWRAHLGSLLRHLFPATADSSEAVL